MTCSLECALKIFFELHSRVWEANFTESLTQLTQIQDTRAGLDTVVQKFVPLRMKERLQEIFEVPAMPKMTDALLKLRVDPLANGQALSKIIEMDPSLAAQVVGWARSPYYGFPGNIDSVEHAIIKVLGYDLVMNLALGISVGKSMQAPLEGPLGLRAFWKFSLYTAALVESLAKILPEEKRPSRGLAYLSGLLHNFGHILLAHVFPPHYYLLNRYIMVNPHVCIPDIEQFVLGVGHEQIGGWLMQAWNMPPELICAIKWHHQEEYTDDYAVYSNLVLVATRLLKTIDLGDAQNTVIPEGVLQFLEITFPQAEFVFEEFLGRADSLDQLVKQMVG